MLIFSILYDHKNNNNISHNAETNISPNQN